MQDNVGDVLAQRATMRSGAAIGIALSLLLHGALSSLAIWAALHHAAAETPRVIDIRLAPVARVSAPVTAATKPAASTVKAPPTQMEKPVVETKKPIVTKPPEKN